MLGAGPSVDMAALAHEARCRVSFAAALHGSWGVVQPGYRRLIPDLNRSHPFGGSGAACLHDQPPSSAAHRLRLALRVPKMASFCRKFRVMSLIARNRTRNRELHMCAPITLSRKRWPARDARHGHHRPSITEIFRSSVFLCVRASLCPSELGHRGTLSSDTEEREVGQLQLTMLSAQSLTHQALGAQRSALNALAREECT